MTDVQRKQPLAPLEFPSIGSASLFEIIIENIEAMVPNVEIIISDQNCLTTPSSCSRSDLDLMVGFDFLREPVALTG